MKSLDELLKLSGEEIKNEINNMSIEEVMALIKELEEMTKDAK